MAKRKYVFMQRWRLFYFGIVEAWRSGASNTEEEKAAHKELAQLSAECLRACREGKQDLMIQKLDVLAGRTLDEYAGNELERMLNGTHEDVPEWLRK